MLEEADGYVDLLDWNNLLGKSYCIRLNAQTQFKSIYGILSPFLPKYRFTPKVCGHVVKLKVNRSKAVKMDDLKVRFKVNDLVFRFKVDGLKERKWMVL